MQLDFAFCVKDNHGWEPEKLQAEARNHPDQWLIDRRQTFICHGCDEKVKFTNSKTKTPFFSVVYEHEDGCDYRNAPSKGGRKALGAAGPARQVAGNREVRYDAPGPLNSAPRGSVGGAQRRRKKAAATGPLYPSTGLRNLLSNLRNGADYPPAGLYLDVPARGPAVPASDYFRRIADITPATVPDGVTRAYWGEISSAHQKTNSDPLWINCDGNGSVFTIKLSAAKKEELYKALETTYERELKYAYVIVEGAMVKDAKLRVDVTDIKKMAFRPKR